MCINTFFAPSSLLITVYLFFCFQSVLEKNFEAGAVIGDCRLSLCALLSKNNKAGLLTVKGCSLVALGLEAYCQGWLKCWGMCLYTPGNLWKKQVLKVLHSHWKRIKKTSRV